MAFFADLLRGVNDRVGYNPDDPDREDNNVDLKLSFNAKPRKHINLDLSKTNEQTVSDAGDVGQNEKTSSKLKINHGECTSSYTFANDKMGFEAKGKAVDDDGWKVDIFGSAEVKQADKKWKIGAGLDIKGSDLGGAKLAMNVPFEYNEKGAITVKPKINLEVADEINIGVSLKTDTKEILEKMPQLVYKPLDNKNSFYWARADLKRKQLMLGCDQKLQDYVSHSFEAVFGWAEKFEGIYGYPLRLRGGVSYELSDQTELSASGSWRGAYDLGMEVQHQVDKNWTVSATQSFSSENVGSKQGAYHIGFAASYKL